MNTYHFWATCTGLICFALFGLGGCSPTVQKRGNMIKSYQMEQIVPNVHTKTDVLKIMGSPTTQAPFDDKLWYYIGQTTEKRGIFDPEVVEETIVTVRFDENDTVLNVDALDTERVDIPIDRGETKTQGNDLTIPQQLLGNLGKFNRPAQAQ